MRNLLVLLVFLDEFLTTLALLEMDPPPTLINQPSFPSSNTAASSFNLSEIWPFQLTNSGGGGGDVGESSSVGLSGGAVRRGGGGGGGGGQGFVQNLCVGFEETSGIGRNHDFSVDESTVTEEQSGRIGNGSKKKRRDEDESKLVSTSNGNEMNDNDGKRPKVLESINGDSKAEVDANSSNFCNKPTEQSAAPPPEPPRQDYIHVRARRGQATDSHSLAERARREKISERMKILQDLVPGCNKVIGKALVLDEIINYIQSLQRQVEFLSMKLEAVNSRNIPSIEGFPPKDMFETAAGMTFVSQGANEFGQGSPPEWLHMQIGGSFERAT